MERKPTRLEFKYYIDQHKSMGHIAADALYDFLESYNWRTQKGTGPEAKTWQSLVNSYNPLIKDGHYPKLVKDSVRYADTEKPWTPDVETILIKDFNNGLDINKISDSLKRRPNAVVCKLLALQLQGMKFRINPLFVR
jgi:hypothetical protein